MHTPVMLKEVLEGLDLNSADMVVDATLGVGGHTRAILEAIAPNGRVVGFDRDDRNLAIARETLADCSDRVTFIHDSFAHLKEYVQERVDAVLFDLGFSSLHVDDASRGFSFQHDGPLDMRYDTRESLTAEMMVNGSSKEDLTDVFRKFGEEPRAPQIAQAIFQARRKHRIRTTGELVNVILSVVPRRGKIHPATKVFQALRMAVNNELGEVQTGLESAVDILKPGGRIAVISFHSLEDRLVKQFFKTHTDLCVITKKPLRACAQEILYNPRSRSAKLRLASKQ